MLDDIEQHTDNHDHLSLGTSENVHRLLPPWSASLSISISLAWGERPTISALYVMSVAAGGG